MFRLFVLSSRITLYGNAIFAIIRHEVESIFFLTRYQMIKLTREYRTFQRELNSVFEHWLNSNSNAENDNLMNVKGIARSVRFYYERNSFICKFKSHFHWKLHFVHFFHCTKTVFIDDRNISRNQKLHIFLRNNPFITNQQQFLFNCTRERKKWNRSHAEECTFRQWAYLWESRKRTLVKESK